MTKRSVTLKLLKQAYEDDLKMLKSLNDKSPWLDGRLSGLRTALVFLDQEKYLQSFDKDKGMVKE